MPEVKSQGLSPRWKAVASALFIFFWASGFIAAKFGLPYAADAAITRHIAAFLQRHQAEAREAVGSEDESSLALPMSAVSAP